MATAHAVAQSGDVGFFFFGKRLRLRRTRYWWRRLLSELLRVVRCTTQTSPPDIVAMRSYVTLCMMMQLFEGEDVAAGVIVSREYFGRSAWF